MSTMLLLLLALPPPEPVGYEAALSYAAERDPASRAAQAELAARTDADAALGALAYDPSLSTRPGYRFGARDTNDGLDGQVTLQQRFSLEGLATIRGDAARTERAALRARVAWRRREAKQRAARSWLTAWAAERALAAQAAMAEDATRLQEKVARAVELGASDRRALARARAFAAESRLEAHAAEGRLFEARMALAAALGRGEAPLATAGDPPELDPSPALSVELVVAARAAPEVRAAEDERRAALERADEAAAAGGWTLSAGAGLAREPPGDLVASALLGLTFPLFGRNQREVARSRAAAARGETEAEASFLEARRARARLAHEVHHATEKAAILTTQLLPARRALLEASERAFELGAEPVRFVIEARRHLLEARIRAFEGRADMVAATQALLLFAASSDMGEGA